MYMQNWRNDRSSKTWKKVTLQELHYIIYSEGSNVCTVIPRKGYLILDKFYVSNVYNWISRNFFIRYKMPQNRKNRQKTGKILMKSFWYFRHCKRLYYINHWYRMCLHDQYILENWKKVLQPIKCTIYRFLKKKYDEILLKLNVGSCSKATISIQWPKLFFLHLVT